MSKWGSASAWFLCDGYDMLANKLQGLRYKAEAITEPTHGIGDSWEEHTPAGVSKAEFAQEGAFFDSSTSGGLLHQMFSGGVVLGTTSAVDVACVGFESQTNGNLFVGLEGLRTNEYEVLAQRGNLTRANATSIVTGRLSDGVILHANGVEGSVYSNDGGAATTNGGVAFLQVTELTLVGSSGVTLRVSDSTDDSTYATLVSFAMSTGIEAQRVTVSGTVERYLTSALTWSGGTSSSSSIKYFVGFSRL